MKSPSFFLGSSATAKGFDSSVAASVLSPVFLCLLDSSLDFFLRSSALRCLSASVSGPMRASRDDLNSEARIFPSAEGSNSRSYFR